MNTDRHRWSWRSCFAVVKHNKKTKKQINHQSILQRINSNGNKHMEKVNENSNILILNKSIEAENHTDVKDESCLVSESSMSNEYDKYIIDSSCIIKIDPLFNDNDNNLIDGDTIEIINSDHFNSTTINNLNASSTIKPTQLDSIIEHYYEDSYDHFDQSANLVRLCCDREIIDDSNNLYSRLFDLSQMKHVITQFNENGNLLNEFTSQIDKLKIKANNILQTSGVMPRDAELLEARYSTLLSTIEILSLLLKIGQIPACRSLINRLIFSIEQRMEQLNKLVQLTLISSENNQQQQRRDINDEDFLSFRSALSSYEHLFTTS